MEPDPDQVETLRFRVAEILPNVSAEFCQETAQNWKGSDERFEAVLLFHCLYYVLQPDRPVLFTKLFDNVLTSGGLVFILVSPCSLKNPTMASRLIELLSLPSYGYVDDVDGVLVRDMMTSVGFLDRYQLSLKYRLDVEEPIEDLLSVFVYWSRGKLSLEQVREALQQVLGGERCLHDDVSFRVFEKP